MLRWADPLDQYGAKAQMLEGIGGGAAWSQADSSWALSSANPATGTYHLRLTATAGGGTEVARRVLGVASQVSGFGYRFNISALPAFEDYDALDSQLVMVDFRDIANVSHCRVSMGTDGSVYAVRGNTLLGRSDPCIAPGGYHHFECKAKIDNTVGYIEVRVNEVTVLNLTGIDTQNTANAATAQFALGEYGDVLDPGAQFGHCDYDDFFAWDNDATDAENTVVDWVGDKGAYWLPVDADTAAAGWLKSSGSSGYSLIDETPPSGTDYIYDSSGAALSRFSVAALPGNVAEVIAFIPVWYGRKEESGSVTIHGGLEIGGSTAVGPDDSPSTAYAYGRPGPKTINPSTGVAWANDAAPNLLIERTV